MSQSLSRRAALLGAVASSCGAQIRTPVDAGQVAPVGEDWMSFALSDYPELTAPGGAAHIERPDALLNIWVVHQEDGSLAAVWSVCTHGACDVAPHFEAQRVLFVCPCHGSRFAADGGVLTGPATRPLRRFEALLVDAVLYLKRA